MRSYFILIGLIILCLMIIVSSIQMVCKNSFKERFSNYILFWLCLSILVFVWGRI